jgi:MerR family transcriptional regulator, heat shock protein HspR
MADTRALYVISVAAELAGVHPQTLRIYERKGLVEPARTSGRSRRYSDEDIELLRRIQELTTEGISLVGVQRILALEAEVRAGLQRVRELQDRVEALTRERNDRVAAAHREYKHELVPRRANTVVRFDSIRK